MSLEIQRPDTTLSKSNPILDKNTTEQEKISEQLPGIRPDNFISYVGQESVLRNFSVYVKAAKNIEKQLDHTILSGPPGLGKTTLARIIANELNAPFYETRGPVIDKAGSLCGILTSLAPGSILFIDEIHRMSVKIEEVLYSALEDFQLDIIVGEGAAARTVVMPLAPFTLIGATTKLSLLSKPLRDRFGIQERLSFYDVDSLTKIVLRTASIINVKVDLEGAKCIAARSRGTPRIANRLLRRIWDFVIADNKQVISFDIASRALELLGIDCMGLDRFDRSLLKVIKDTYNGGPVGIEAISATLNEDRATLEEVSEPFLIYSGLLLRSPRGRMLSEKGHQHVLDTAGLN